MLRVRRAPPGQSYPAIYIVGYVNNVYGIWQLTNNAQSWTNIGTDPTGELDEIYTISGDPNQYGEVYVGFRWQAGTPICPHLGERLDEHRRAGCGHECDLERADRQRHSDADAHRRAELNDTHAVTNASYAIAITDTAANVFANIDALNADTHVTSIALTPTAGLRC